VIVAAALTSASFAAVSLAMRESSAWTVAAVQRDPALPTERVVLLMLPESPALIERLRLARPLRSGDRMPTSAHDAKRSIAHPPRDSSSTQPIPAATRVTEPTGAAFPLAPQPLPTRLLSPAARTVPWYSLPGQRNPFVPTEPLSAAERDSVLLAAAERFAELAARRVPTQSERDAAAKEAMLKMRLTGRILLVPPDNSGGLITMPLPLFGGGPTKARRARDRQAFDENRARLERLRQRADSARRARGDSLPN
jgi:hypothetical protein